MESKTLRLIVLSIFAFTLLAGFASAVSLASIDLVSSPSEVVHDAGSFDIVFDLENTGVAGDLDFTFTDFTSVQAGLSISFDKLVIGATTTETYVATISFSSHQIGDITGNIAIGNDNTEADVTISFIVPIDSSDELSVELTTPLTKTQNGMITITNDGNTELTNLELVIGTADFSVTFSDFSLELPLAAGGTIDVEVSSTNVVDLELGDDNTLTIKATADEVESFELTLTVPVDFYEGENEGELKITDIDFSVEEGFGDDEDFWYPLDEIEVTVDIDNKGEWDIEDIEILVCLLDIDTGSCIIDEDDMDLSDDDFDLDENDDLTVTLTFKIDPDDLDAGNNNYEFHVSAVGEIDDSKSAFDKDETGDSSSKNIEIRTGEKFIILDDFQINGIKLDENMRSLETVSCGSELQITTDVWNVGDDRIKEEDVHVRIYNRDLGINEVITDLNDISALDKEVLTFTFKVPNGLEEKTYGILFEVYDDEDLSDKDIYENKEDDESEFTILMKVEGDCGSAKGDVSITANLISEAKAGQSLTVRTTITNTLPDSSSFSVSAAGFGSWASSVQIDQPTLLLNAGESRDVLLTFDVSKDAKGSQTFFVELVSDNGEVTRQPVQVEVESGSLFGGLGGSNAYLWGIGALNIILVVVIIVVAVRIARR